MWIAGVDGCRAGWIVVLATLTSAQGRRPTSLQVVVCPRFRDVLALAPRPQTIAVDMPIGFASVAETGGRPCDRLARGELGSRASTIFSPPSRPALEVARRGGTYAEVCAANRATRPEAPAISIQSFNITPKLVELDDVITPHLQRRVREAHPELAFLRANKGVPLAPKKTTDGASQRRSILQALGYLPEEGSRPGGVTRDDLHDAAILCLVAHRMANGTVLSRGGERDARGLRMEIVT